MTKDEIKEVKEEYDKLLRRNKKAREVFSKKKGYSSTEVHIAFLRGILTAAGEYKPKTSKKKTVSKNVVKKVTKKVKKKSKVKDVIIHVFDLLDASSSMHIGRKMTKAIEGINLQTAELKKDTSAEYIYSFSSFSGNGDIMNHQYRTPIKLVPGSIRINPRGLTALNQAICLTIESLIRDKREGEKTVLKIFTDGGENASLSKYNNKAVEKAIILAEANDITVTFVGTVNDASYAVNNYGIRNGNVLVHDNTNSGVEMAFKTTSQATRTYSNKVKKGEAVLDGFYKQEGTL